MKTLPKMAGFSFSKGLNYHKKHSLPSSYGMVIMLAVSYKVKYLIFTELPLQKFIPSVIDRQSALYITGGMEQIIYVIMMIGMLKWLGLFRYAGITGVKFWRQGWLTWPVLPFCLLNAWSFLAGSYIMDLNNIVLYVSYLIYYISVGLFEEIVCRGAMLTIILRKYGINRKGVYLSVLITSLLFGSAHIINFIMGRFSLLSVLSQIIYATFFGTFFSACLLRSRSIWPIVLSHALFDLCGNLTDLPVNGTYGSLYQAGFSEAMVSVVLLLPLFLYGLFLLRKVKIAFQNE